MAAIPSIDEVNFWKPSASGFHAIGEGERFAFKLKAPRNAIGGFGVLAESSVLPIGTAWEAFGIKNGVPSLDEFVAAISRYRPGERVTASTFIGCRILVEPVFLEEDRWLAPPATGLGTLLAVRPTQRTTATALNYGASSITSAVPRRQDWRSSTRLVSASRR